jgi:hypothetical protein
MEIRPVEPGDLAQLASHLPATDGPTHEVCVDIDNPGARALYERLGFAESGIGVFATSGTFTDEGGTERARRNGPQVLLVRSLTQPA